MFKEKFKSSLLKLHSTKYLALLGIFIALKIALSTFYLSLSVSLRIYFTFFITAIEAAIYGPSVALISGFISDNLGFILFPSGTYHFGYTISAMLGGFIFAMFLYDQNITIVKLILSKLIINIFVNVGLGSLWASQLFGKAYIFYFTKSVIKNISLLPLEILILIISFNALLPLLTKKGLIKPSKLPLKLI